MTTVSQASIKKGKGLQKPDPAVYKKFLSEVDSKISALKEELDQVSKQINQFDSGKGKDGDPRSQLRKRLNELKDEQAVLKSSRQSKIDEISTIQASIKKKLGDLKTLQSKTSFRSLTDLEDHVQKLERQVESGKLKVIEEKKVLNEVSQLKKSKKSYDAIMDLEDAVEEDRSKLDKLRALVDDSKSKAINSEYDEIKSKLDKLNTSNNEVWAKKSKFFEKRDEVRKLIDAQYDKRRELISENKQALDTYYQWKSEDNKKRQEQAEARKRQEDLEHLTELANEERAIAEIPAFEAEIAQCTTLLGYFQRLSGTTDSAKSDTKSETDKPELVKVEPVVRQVDASNAPQGKALVKKSDREDIFFSGSKSKKPVKKQGGKGSNKAAFTVPLAIVDSLSGLRLPIPTSTAKVPELLDAIQQKIKFFKANQAKATAEKKARAEAKIEALKAQFGLESEATTTQIEAN